MWQIHLQSDLSRQILLCSAKAMMSKTHQAGAQRQCGASAVDLEMAGGHPGAAWCFSLILLLGVRISAHLYQSFAEAGHGSHPDGW
jgi:hypothetical protein